MALKKIAEATSTNSSIIEITNIPQESGIMYLYFAGGVSDRTDIRVYVNNNLASGSYSQNYFWDEGLDLGPAGSLQTKSTHQTSSFGSFDRMFSFRAMNGKTSLECIFVNINTNKTQVALFRGVSVDPDAGDSSNQIGGGNYNVQEPITSVHLECASGTFATGSNISLYAVQEI